MTLLYLLRHGAIDWPEADCFIGQTDAPLSAEGRRQAGACRSELRNLEFTAVWSSDLTRATETAGIIFAGCAASIRTCRELREIQLGEWDGQPRGRVRESHPDHWRARGEDLADFRPPGGESFRDLQQRVVPQIARIAEETQGTACIVTHAGVIRVLICHMLQIPLSNIFRIRLDYGCVSIVAYSPGRVEVCALNLRPSNLSCSPGGEIGGPHDPAQV
ncbi:MAG: alpha-ribazole phosphatase [Deltaproteobacteria bacterium]|nr:alpha-ribazole phosphatase [Deltaproteobacteria bacterium]